MPELIAATPALVASQEAPGSLGGHEIAPESHDLHDVTPAGYSRAAEPPRPPEKVAAMGHKKPAAKRALGRPLMAASAAMLLGGIAAVSFGLRGSPAASPNAEIADTTVAAAPGAAPAPARAAPAAARAEPTPAAATPRAAAVPTEKAPSVPAEVPVAKASRAPAELPKAIPAPVPAQAVSDDSAIPAYAPADRVRISIDAGLLRAKRCHLAGRATGTVRVFVTFDPTGRVSDARLQDEPIASAPVARCVLDQMRAILIPKFDGPAFTLERSLTLR
jgi:hypothetical protein